MSVFDLGRAALFPLILPMGGEGTLRQTALFLSLPHSEGMSAKFFIPFLEGPEMSYPTFSSPFPPYRAGSLSFFFFFPFYKHKR